ncbi:MAG: alpha/beta hydrolase, partial [Xanthomonadaceae bacterium]|nr:alpha/beta hydrolase [Xanthomonadaceae bacterium]
TMPVLGLWCNGDKVIDISAQDSLRNGLTHASAISTSTLVGCDHIPQLEKPGETAQVLTAFALSH